jgi:hypothetical protein
MKWYNMSIENWRREVDVQPYKVLLWNRVMLVLAKVSKFVDPELHFESSLKRELKFVDHDHKFRVEFELQVFYSIMSRPVQIVDPNSEHQNQMHELDHDPGRQR